MRREPFLFLRGKASQFYTGARGDVDMSFLSDSPKSIEAVYYDKFEELTKALDLKCENDAVPTLFRQQIIAEAQLEGEKGSGALWIAASSLLVAFISLLFATFSSLSSLSTGHDANLLAEAGSGVFISNLIFTIVLALVICLVVIRNKRKIIEKSIENNLLKFFLKHGIPQEKTSQHEVLHMDRIVTKEKHISFSYQEE